MVVPVLTRHLGGAGDAALLRAIARRPQNDPVAIFYQERRGRPIWFSGGRLPPEAGQMLALLRGAGHEGLTSAQFHPDELAAVLAAASERNPASIASAEIALSEAFAAYAVRLHNPASADALAFVDPAISLPPSDPRRALEALARAPTLAVALRNVQRMNQIYVQLRAALDAASPGREAELERANLDRARALPADLGPRYILVNAAAQTLWLYDHGRVTDQMRVVVGKPAEPTPSMIGLMRYAVLDPFWNVPPALTRDSIAPKQRANPSYVAAHHFQVLSDWSPGAKLIQPSTVDWAGVERGAQTVRLRQLPGTDNMMGKVKFMLPNPLGVYLHDTPMKRLFGGRRRTDSAGCVRLADAAELGQRLFGRALVANSAAGPEQRVDLASPVPVYILYLTRQPSQGGVIHAPDIYGRDRQRLAANNMTRPRINPRATFRGRGSVRRLFSRRPQRG